MFENFLKKGWLLYGQVVTNFDPEKDDVGTVDGSINE